MKYLQCDLVKENPLIRHSLLDVPYILQKTCWLPKEFAKKGKYIKLKTEDGYWDNGWKVEEVYVGIEFDEDTMLKRSQDYKKQREMSDI